jgi:predicted nucleic acid-binding protein
MSGTGKVVIDTNSLIYFFDGNQKVIDAISEETLYISVISEIELLSFSKLDEESEFYIKEFLKDDFCKLIGLIEPIKEIAIRIRKIYKIKLPDSIVAATAIFLNLPLLTFDKGFSKIKELNLILLKF